MFAMAKRISLFLVVNFLVLITVSLVLQVFGIQPYLSKQGFNYQSLMIFCILWGMLGSFISLAMSKRMAKWGMGVQVVEPTSQDPLLRSLLNTVQELSLKANLPMPEVGIYESPEINAFATGMTKRGALVAVSTGLLQRMTEEERAGVLGHELAHISNGDMVTMALLQGVINAFVMFLARVIAQVLMRSDNGRGGGSFIGYYMTVFVLEMIFMLLGSIVVATFSRWREFHADSGGAYLAGKENMISALECLQRNYDIQDPRAAEQDQFQTMKISTHSRFMKLFSTHPPLDKRIASLKSNPRPTL